MFTEKKEFMLCTMCRMLIFRADRMTEVLTYICQHSA